MTCIIVIYIHTNICVCLGCEYPSGQNRVLLVFLFLVGWIKWTPNLSCKTVNDLEVTLFIFCLFIPHITPHNSSYLVVTINTYLSNVVNKNKLTLGDLNFIIEVFMLLNHVWDEEASRIFLWILMKTYHFHSQIHMRKVCRSWSLVWGRDKWNLIINSPLWMTLVILHLN